MDPTRKVCPCCEGAMDQWGDHLVNCKMNQPQQRHNALRDALADELKAHGVAVLKEVAVGGARRPADLGLPTFDSRGPTAVDLVVHHPLALSENRTSQLAFLTSQIRNQKKSRIRGTLHCQWLAVLSDGMAPMGRSRTTRSGLEVPD